MSRQLIPPILLALVSVLGWACDGRSLTQPTDIAANPPTELATSAASGVSRLPPFPDPDDFVKVIDNPYFPLRPGTRFIYRGADGDEPLINVTDVTNADRTILGVKVTVVLDRVFISGELAEKTFDFYAQDKHGNVWYLGEDTKEYENGKVVTTAGTFEAGKHGATAGIVMRAHPKVGETTQQEFAPGVAEDAGTVLTLDATVTAPYGTFHHCLESRDFTPLEPGAVEVKFYCPSIGFVKGRDISGGSVHTALTRIVR